MMVFKKLEVLSAADINNSFGGLEKPRIIRAFNQQRSLYFMKLGLISAGILGLFVSVILAFTLNSRNQPDTHASTIAIANPTQQTSSPATIETNKDTSMILMQTSLGPIHIELNHEKAPISAANFQSLVESGFYDGLIFHRVIDNFMIQGGGMTPDMEEKREGSPIQNEADNGLKNIRGSLAMARTSDPHSATAQFFINLNDNTFLDHTSKDMQGWGYAVFGQVTEGMEVVDQIRAVPTGNKGGHSDVPLEPILIKSATVVE